MSKSVSTYFLFTALVVPALFVLGLLGYQHFLQELPILGPYETVKGKKNLITTPQWSFTNQNEETISSKDVEDQIQVLNFFFTSCPTVCPRMNKNVQMVQQVFINDETISFISISVDPERDNPKRLKHYESLFSLNKDQWHFLTGNKEEIFLLARKGYNLSASEADEGNGNILHSQQVLLIDTNQQIRGVYNGTVKEEMEDLVKDISKLKKELKLKS